ncbi:MAG: outer membrane beta-barrel domain-containing protein [Deltaproteobacteria bacterium]|nr:outer membrane beta-barrel domain-containing protein [Deltaproteobacteria bacterium]
MSRVSLKIVGLVLFSATPAFAADLPGDPGAAPDAKATPAKAEAVDPDLMKKAADESIYVVQRRAYSKSRSFEATPFFFTSLNNKFVGHLGPGVALAFHARENLAVEVVSSIPGATVGFYSALVDEVYRQESLTPEDVDLKQVSYFGGLALQFSALYGKFEFYGWLIDYDFYATIGFAGVSTKETCFPGRDEGCSSDADISTGRGLRVPLTQGDQWKLAGQMGGGMRFFFSDFLGLRLEIRDIAYADRAFYQGVTTTDTRGNVFFILGVSVLL